MTFGMYFAIWGIIDIIIIFLIAYKKNYECIDFDLILEMIVISIPTSFVWGLFYCLFVGITLGLLGKW